MESTVESFLENIGLNCFINIFKEHDLDEDALRLLATFPENLPCVLPNVKDRLKFQKAMRDGAHNMHIILPSREFLDGEPPLKRAKIDEVSHGEQNAADGETSQNKIIKILEKSAQGKAVIEHFKLGFDNNCRSLLSELIIQDCFGANTNKTLSRAEFIELAQSITQAFPGECQESYYVPSSERGKGRTASGKLYDQYANLNKLLRKVGLRKLRPGQSESTVVVSSSLDKPNCDEKLEADLLYLKTYSEPWDLIKEKWTRTSALRLHFLRDTDNNATISEYISSYPCLGLAGCHLLFEIDFQILYKDAANSIKNRWKDITALLKKELEKEKIKCGDSDAEILYSFPLLFPVVPVKIPGPKRKPWRASRPEIQEGFLVHLNSTLEDYEEIPVDVFGMAMLRGMGWKPGEGIGKTKKLVAAALPELRPRGMGLGADKVVMQNKNVQSKTKEEEELKLEKGTFVKVLKGKHTNYGQIEGFDDDPTRVFVKMALSGEILSLNVGVLQPVTKSEYSKNSKVLNTTKFEQYKNKPITLNLSDEESTDDRERKHNQAETSRSDSRSTKKSKKHSKYSSDDSSDSGHRSRKRRSESSDSDHKYKQKKTKKSKKSHRHDSSEERTSKKSKKKDKDRERTREQKSGSSSQRKQKKHKRSRSSTPRRR